MRLDKSRYVLRVGLEYVLIELMSAACPKAELDIKRADRRMVT
jgi:hypothetical protein